MKDKLKKIRDDGVLKIAKVKSLKELKDVERFYLGKGSELSLVLSSLKGLSVEEKKVIGPLVNEIKKELKGLIDKKEKEIEKEEVLKKLNDEFFDITMPVKSNINGHIHILAQIQNEIENIFSDMGFAVVDGPEVESEYYNFEGLNIPKDHPARDMQDTFFVTDKHESKHGRLVLRTQTSPVQVRTMERFGAPLRVIAPGRTFRNEATDASHEHTFHQVEGLLIDKDISLAHLKGVMKEFLARLFKADVDVRFRPGYFPFVEPGVELDFSCVLCKGKGCSMCKNTGWVEFMGAGMVHPNVLKAGGIDSKKYTGWAFGFGMERLAIMRYKIEDIRLFHSGDLRFLQQF